MKKLIATVLTILTCGAAYALPLGNPTEASLYLNGVCWDRGCCDPCDPCFSWCDAWSLRIGFYGDYVWNRHLEISSGGDNHADIKDTRIFTNAGLITLNICNRLDVFATLGVTNLDIRTPGRTFGLIDNRMIELVYHDEFSWSVGARATIWECSCFGIGLEGQYFQTRPDISYLLDYGSGQVIEFNETSRKHRYHEWQVGLGASYRFATSCPTIALVPYTGVLWSWSRLDSNADTITIGTAELVTLHDLKAKKLWAWALGVSFTLCDMVGITVEGRWAGEKGLHVNGQFRF